MCIIINTFVKIESPWVTLIGENIQDKSGKKMEYWRVIKADSIIVLPIYKNMLVLPEPYYRHGVQDMTYDFPGGRADIKEKLNKTALDIIKREIDLDKDFIVSLSTINNEGWNINSSFSNQKLFGFAAEISESFQFTTSHNVTFFPISEKNIKKLLVKISCLQCRAVLLDWYFKQNK